jgi:hypothetical protein
MSISSTIPFILHKYLRTESLWSARHKESEAAASKGAIPRPNLTSIWYAVVVETVEHGSGGAEAFHRHPVRLLEPWPSTITYSKDTLWCVSKRQCLSNFLSHVLEINR